MIKLIYGNAGFSFEGEIVVNRKNLPKVIERCQLETYTKIIPNMQGFQGLHIEYLSGTVPQVKAALKYIKASKVKVKVLNVADLKLLYDINHHNIHAYVKFHIHKNQMCYINRNILYNVHNVPKEFYYVSDKFILRNEDFSGELEKALLNPDCTIKYLGLEYTSSTDEMINAIKQNKSIQTLKLQSNVDYELGENITEVILKRYNDYFNNSIITNILASPNLKSLITKYCDNLEFGSISDKLVNYVGDNKWIHKKVKANIKFQETIRFKKTKSAANY